MKSPSWELPSSPIGVSKFTGSWLIFKISRTFWGVAALGLDDHSGRYPVERWTALAVSLYQSCKADCVVAGANDGGKLVRAWLGQLDPEVPVHLERASYGSDLPAEPVSALYDQSRLHHIAAFPTLEDQMVTFIPYRKRDAQGSATRVAALVWAITELVVRYQPRRAGGVRLSRR
jgi:phage terminase large subunit-like protein